MTMTDHQDDDKSPRSALGGLLALQSAIVVAEHRREQEEAARAASAAEHERADAQERRIDELERKLHVAMRATIKHIDRTRTLEQQIRSITAAVIQLQASRAVPARKTPRRDELDAALERELIGE